MRKLTIVFFVLSLLIPTNLVLAFATCPPEFCPPEPPPTPDPIVIVPGIVGSWNWDVLLHDGTGGTWDFTPFTNVYQPLVDALRTEFANQGLDPDKNVFIAFYDWRQPNVLSSQDYLKPIIEKAKQESGKEKIDIIAHSMGGILARSYIQGGHYNGDVDQLFMLGTPNYGSSDVYTLWEGGHIPTNWDFAQRVFFTVYFFLKDRALSDLAKYNLVHNQITSIRDLLPTYDYLKDGDTLKTTTGLNEQNITLNTFNNNIADLESLVGSVTTIAGNDQGTVGEISIVNPQAEENPLWKDGKPDPIDPNRNSSEGDNRVLLSSAHIQTILDHVTLGNAKHADLPSKAGSELFSRLGFSDPGQLALIEQPDKILSFMFASPVIPTVTAPNGIVSKDVSTIPDVIYFGENDPTGLKMILIPNPQDGEYKVDLLGNGTGHYDFASAYFKENIPDSLQSFSGEITNGQTVSYSSNLNESNGNPLESELFVNRESLKQTIKHFLSIGAIKKKYVADALIALVNAHQKSKPKGKFAIVKTFEIAVRAFERLKLVEPAVAEALIQQMKAM